MTPTLTLSLPTLTLAIAAASAAGAVMTLLALRSMLADVVAGTAIIAGYDERAAGWLARHQARHNRYRPRHAVVSQPRRRLVDPANLDAAFARYTSWRGRLARAVHARRERLTWPPFGDLLPAYVRHEVVL